MTKPTVAANAASMSDTLTTRRGFLGHMAGAYLAAGATATVTATVTAAALADPLADMIAAYWREVETANAFPGDVPDDFPWAAMQALDDDTIPAPATRQTALDALRLAKNECRYMLAPPMVGQLITAALAYFEANA